MRMSVRRGLRPMAMCRSLDTGRSIASGSAVAVSGQRSAVSGQRSAVSGRRSAVSGQRSAVSGQRSAVSGSDFKTADLPTRRPADSPTSRIASASNAPDLATNTNTPGAAVLFRVGDTDDPPQIQKRVGDELLLPLLSVRRSSVTRRLAHAAPLLEPAHHLLEMLARAVERSEMRQEQRVGIPAENLRLALAPLLEIDVGRRRRRHDVLPRPAPDPGRVADEGDARGRLEVADVMRGMSRGVGDLQRPPPAAIVSPPFNSRSRSRGTARNSPHSRSMSWPYRRVALESSLVGSARCVAPRSWTNTSIAGFSLTSVPVHPAWSRWMCVSRIWRTSAIRDTAALQRRTERRQARRRSGIDQRHAARPMEHGRRDDVRVAEKVEVDVVDACGEADHRSVLWIAGSPAGV